MVTTMDETKNITLGVLTFAIAIYIRQNLYHWIREVDIDH
jgi:hypothetical protein